jgi:hypothetical protein
MSPPFDEECIDATDREKKFIYCRSNVASKSHPWLLKRLFKLVIVLPPLRFGLGALFGLCASVAICFFPFPEGKLLSMVMGPLSLVFAFLIDKYTNTSVCMPSTAMNIVQGRASFLCAMTVYIGMFFGTSHVVSQLHYAIASSPAENQVRMEIFPQKLFLELNEVCFLPLYDVMIVICMSMVVIVLKDTVDY